MSVWKELAGKYPLENYPGYEPGKPPRVDLLHKMHYLDTLEKVWGKKWGAQGIGRLREVAMSRPTENEVNPIFEKDPAFFLMFYGMPNLEKWQEGWDNLYNILKEQGVKIDLLEYPAPLIGPYGPYRKLTYLTEPLVIRGGTIIGRYGHCPYKIGLERHYQRFLAEIGCPILYTVHGNGIWEPGPSVFIAEDVLVTHVGVAGNMEGIEQCMPVLQRAGVKEVHIAHVPGYVGTIEWPASGIHHTDMWIGPVDIGVVVIYPAWCGYETVRWLRDKGFKLIEVPPEEQRIYTPPNLIPLEPGKVLMPTGPEKTIRAVRKEGVDVIEVESPGILAGGGGGLRCSTLPLIRDPGPSLEEIKR